MVPIIAPPAICTLLPFQGLARVTIPGSPPHQSVASQEVSCLVHPAQNASQLIGPPSLGSASENLALVHSQGCQLISLATCLI